jgi:MoaA/NifB/PqqE/SkfB family radical SAM enzyme
MRKIIIEAPFDYYYGVFLNLTCSLPCEYCVQKISLPERPIAKYPIVSGKDWVEALNAVTDRTKARFLRAPKKKKISITGGEPSLHPDFIYILNNLDKDWKITVTSNFTSPFFDQDSKFLKQIKRRRNLKFNASFHFMYTPIEKFIENVLKVRRRGFFVHSLFIVAHPARMKEIEGYKERLLKIHPVVKLQRFFGFHDGGLYPREGAYTIVCEQEDGIRNYEAYREGFNQSAQKDIYCRMKKVLFAPNGDIYNCHYKLYTAHKDKFGNIFEPSALRPCSGPMVSMAEPSAKDQGVRIIMPQDFFLCHDYGFCNPCDSEAHAFKALDGKEFNIG